jgi:hypothetical protein
MKFDFKVTTWERITVDEEDVQQVLQGIKNGTLTSSNDIFNLIEGCESEILDEATVQMSVAENGGECTIEVISEDGETIFTNAAKN